MSDARFLRRNFLIWGLLAFGAAMLHALDGVVMGRAMNLARLFQDLPLIALWATATPWIIESAKRFPLRGDLALRHAGFHALSGITFVILTNLVIRLPLLRSGVSRLITETLHGLTVYFPGAIALYAVVVAAGHWSGQRTNQREEHVAEVGVETESIADGRLVVREWNRVHLVDVDQIEWIEASNNHVVVHTAARSYKGRERMSDVESRLDTRRFVRVHRSAIVQLTKIREVQPLLHGDQAIILHSGTVVRVARSRRAALESALGTPL